MNWITHLLGHEDTVRELIIHDHGTQVELIIREKEPEREVMSVHLMADDLSDFIGSLLHVQSKLKKRGGQNG